MKNIEIMFEQNLPLVKSIYNKHFYFPSEEDKEDILSAGRVGLLVACQKYDESKGFKFSSFAYKVIYSKMALHIRDFIQPHKDVISICTKIQSSDELTIEDTLSYSHDYLESLEKEEQIKLIQRFEILPIYIKGIPQDKIAKRFGCSQTTISRKIKIEIEMAKRMYA